MLPQVALHATNPILGLAEKLAATARDTSHDRGADLSITIGHITGTGNAAETTSAAQVSSYTSTWHTTEGRDIRPYVMEPSGLAHLDDHGSHSTLVSTAIPDSTSVQRDTSESLVRPLAHTSTALEWGDALILQSLSRPWQLALGPRAAATSGGGRGVRAGAGAGG